MFLSLSLHGQTYTTTKIQTNFLMTSTMIWNYGNNQWDFVDNNDLTSFPSEWIFMVDSNSRGMISNGSIDYDILEYKYVSDSSLFFEVFNNKVLRKMSMIVSKSALGFNVAILDKRERIAYFFIQ